MTVLLEGVGLASSCVSPTRENSFNTASFQRSLVMTSAIRIKLDLRNFSVLTTRKTRFDYVPKSFYFQTDRKLLERSLLEKSSKKYKNQKRTEEVMITKE